MSATTAGEEERAAWVALGAALRKLSVLPPDRAARVARMETAIRKLPVLPRYEWLIRSFATLVDGKFNLADYKNEKQMPIWQQRSTTKQAIAELADLAKLSLALHNHIRKMGIEAHAALRAVSTILRRHQLEKSLPSDRDLIAPLLEDDLDRLAIHVKNTHAVAREAIDHVRGSRIQGKPVARAVTDAAAKVYQELTGKAPGRIASGVEVNGHILGQRDGGQFIAFLADVFEALGIDAKAAGQAKLLSKRRPPARAPQGFRRVR